VTLRIIWRKRLRAIWRGEAFWGRIAPTAAKLETREYSGPLRHHSTCRRGSAANFQSDTSAFMETLYPVFRAW
jgi:hypothetical protein